MMRTYPLKDIMSYKELAFFELKTNLCNHKIRAIKSGEYREPKAGEWFLSGATVEAYRTKNNLSNKYFIAKLAKIETVEVVKIIKVME